MTRTEHSTRRPVVAAVGLLVAAIVLTAGAPMAVAEEDCCGCGFSSAVPLSGAKTMPCAFDHPAGWEVVAGDDGGVVQVAIGPPPCATPCPVSSGIGIMVAKKADPNAASMEEVWRQVMRVVGTAECGGRAVTFFALPGADPAGLGGGVKFHVGHGGKAFGGTATFTCSEPRAWVHIQDLFVNSFRTNEGNVFEGR